ncbi:MAG TPA: peptidylprolyl isomerase [Acidimicrobiia bacterium]|nr:peptidylprolyl isomerase [Acidimicrobiia bacterium]
MREGRGRPAAFALIVALSLLGGGCSNGGGSRPRVAAVVEGTRIASSETEAMVDAYLRRQSPQPMGEDTPRDQIAKGVLEYQIKLTSLEHLAATLGVSSEPASYFDSTARLIQPEDTGRIGERPEDLARELQAGRLSQAMAKKLFPDVSISDAAVQAEYERRAPLLDRHWKATAQLARFGAEDPATQLRTRVGAGERFADVASALGAADVATVDVNPVVAPLPAAVLDALGKLPPGAVSQPIPAGGAWIVARLESRQDVPRLTLDELRPELTKYLAERERQDRFQDWFQTKFAATAVKVSSYYGKWDAQHTTVD